MELLAVLQGWCPWCERHMGWWGGWGMMFGWLILLLLIAGIAWLMLRRAGGPAGDPAERLLRERYARGEIDEESYRRMLAELHRR